MSESFYKILGVSEQATQEEIKRAYRQLSLKSHPDKNPGDQQSSERFREIDEAYKILETYCHSCEGSSASKENNEYSFMQDDVENVFIANRKKVTV